MNLAGHVVANTAVFGEKPAFITDDGVVTYRDLGKLIRSGAAWLDKQGVKSGDVVGIGIAEPTAHIIASLSLGYLGITQIYMSPYAKSAAEESIATRARMGLLLVQPDCKPTTRFPTLEFTPSRSQASISPIYDDLLNDAPEAPYIINIGSGTTGAPKFIAYDQKIAYERTINTRPFIIETDIILSMVPLSFWSGKQTVMAALLAGATMLFMSPSSAIQNFVSVVRRFSVSYVKLTPFHAHQILDRLPAPAQLDSIRVFKMSSTRVDESLRHNVARSLTQNIAVIYGSNEVGTISFASPPLALTHPHTVGRAPDHVTIEIVDEQDRPLPPNSPGLIRVKSTCAVDGYCDDPDATARAFRDGWFYPGDLGELTHDRLLIHHGRADDMMIYDGINIFPAEIERVLLDHAAVVEAAAFPISSERHGNLPAAAVTVNAAVETHELIAFCRARLGVATPKVLRIVDHMPRTANGKIRKVELANQFSRATCLSSGSERSRFKAESCSTSFPPLAESLEPCCFPNGLPKDTNSCQGHEPTAGQMGDGPARPPPWRARTRQACAGLAPRPTRPKRARPR